jgi:hypothetical protein
VARVFNGSSQYLERSGDLVGSAPVTLSCWFRADNATQLHPLITVESTAYSDWISLMADGVTAGDPIQANAASGGSVSIATVSSFSANTWHHAAATFYPVFGTFIGDRYAFIDGVAGAKGSGTQSYMRTPIKTRIGIHGGYGAYLLGRIAYVAIWNVALTADEIADLGRKLNGAPCGVHPIRIRPESLVGCWPLGGFHGEHDGDIWANSYNMTASGSPTWDESPAVIYPSRKKIIFPVSSAAPPSSTKYSWWAWNTFGTPLDHDARS